MTPVDGQNAITTQSITIAGITTGTVSDIVGIMRIIGTLR